MALIIQVKDTPDKFRPMADTVVPPLLDLLRARSALEGEIHDRWEALEQAHLAAGHSRNQLPDGGLALAAEYKRRYLELVEHRCVPGFLQYGGEVSFGMPTKYGYLEDDPACQVVFTMKSAKKAIVETYGHNGSMIVRQRFTLRPGEPEWLIGRVEYGYGGGAEWHVDHYV